MALNLFVILSVSFPCFAQAQDLSLANLAPPKIQANSPTKLQVRESVVESDGLKYKRIEYKNEVFYLRLQSKEEVRDPIKPDTEGSTLVKDENRECTKTLPSGETNALILVKAKISSVASVYVESLRNKCRTFDAKREWDGEAGLKLQTSKDSEIRLGVDAAPGAAVTPKGSVNFGF